jgi:hypothetical protein
MCNASRCAHTEFRWAGGSTSTAHHPTTVGPPPPFPLPRPTQSIAPLSSATMHGALRDLLRAVDAMPPFLNDTRFGAAGASPTRVGSSAGPSSPSSPITYWGAGGARATPFSAASGPYPGVYPSPHAPVVPPGTSGVSGGEGAAWPLGPGAGASGSFVGSPPSLTATTAPQAGAHGGALVRPPAVAVGGTGAATMKPASPLSGTPRGRAAAAAAAAAAAVAAAAAAAEAAAVAAAAAAEDGAPPSEVQVGAALW